MSASIGDLLHRVGVGLGDLLDLHAALDGGDAEVGAVGAVEQEGEVVLLGEDPEERLDHGDGLLEDRLGELRLGRDLARLRGVDAGAGVDRDLLHGVGVGLGDLLDLDAALDGRDAEVLPVGAVEQEGEVVLLHRRRRRGDQHPVDRQPLDLHPEDVRRVLEGLVRRSSPA